jgi:hypothetical protein
MLFSFFKYLFCFWFLFLFLLVVLVFEFRASCLLASALPLELLCQSPISFFKCIFVVQRGFTMVFHPWIYCTLISLIPSITFLSPPPTPISQQLLACFFMLASYTDEIYFDITHFLSFSFCLLPLPSPLKQFHYYRLVICVCVYGHLHLCTGLSSGPMYIFGIVWYNTVTTSITYQDIRTIRQSINLSEILFFFFVLFLFFFWRPRQDTNLSEILAHR